MGIVDKYSLNNSKATFYVVLKLQFDLRFGRDLIGYFFDQPTSFQDFDTLVKIVTLLRTGACPIPHWNPSSLDNY